jgi:hypothetical protein
MTTSRTTEGGFARALRLVPRILGILWHLFVDDGFLAAGLLVWIGLAALLIPALGWREGGGPTLFVGAAGLLAGSVARAARRR